MRRAHPLELGSGTIPYIGRHSGPPFAPNLPLTSDVSSQLKTYISVSIAAWSGLGRSRELPSILNNEEHHRRYGFDPPLVAAAQ